MFYFLSIYGTISAALLIGSLLAFGMVGLLISASVVFGILLLGGAAMLMVSEFRDVAAHPDEYDPKSIKGMIRKGWARLV